MITCLKCDSKAIYYVEVYYMNKKGKTFCCEEHKNEYCKLLKETHHKFSINKNENAKNYKD